MANYDLIVDDIWDVWEVLLLEHFLDIFPVFRKACNSESSDSFIVIL